MKTLALTILAVFIISSSANAGMGVCHDGNGNITRLDLDANHAFFKNTPNCKYFEVWKDGITDDGYMNLKSLLTNTPRKHIKWGLSGKPEEMTQAEKDGADLAEAQILKASQIAEVTEFEVRMKDVIVALVKVINSRLPAGQKITKEEIIQQIKSDMGL